MAGEINAGNVFNMCDKEGKGYLVLADLRNVSPDVSADELAYIFEQMDLNGDGRISKSEFIATFDAVLNKAEQGGYVGVMDKVRRQSKAFLPEIVYDGSASGVADLLSDMACQEEILTLYEKLQSTAMPGVIQQFEKVIGSFCIEIKEQKEQNMRLQKKYDQERKYLNQALNEVENEFEKHVELATEKARQEERDRLEREKEHMRQSLESEIVQLQKNIQQLHKMEQVFNAETENAQRMQDLKHRLQELTGENRLLKTDLTEKQIEMTLIKTEMARVRQENEEKLHDLIAEKEELLATLGQQSTIQRQLQLLCDANKKLHDTNDSLRVALDTRSGIMRQYNMRTPSPTATPVFGHIGRPHSLRVSQQNSRSRPDTDDDLDSGIVLARPRPNADDSEGLSSEHSTDIENHVSTRSAVSQGVSPSTPSRTFRVVLAGDANVGKSSLIMRMIRNQYVSDLPATLGVDFHVKIMNIDGQCVALQLWDTAGQERFRSLSKSYFRRADGAILVFDVANESSFLNVREWIETVQDATARPIPVYICANKVDKRLEKVGKDRFVNHDDGRKLAESYNAFYMETSAKTGDNVEEVATNIIREMLLHEDQEVNASGLVLKNVPPSNRNCLGRKTCSA